jgi:hypothetical protein
MSPAAGSTIRDRALSAALLTVAALLSLYFATLRIELNDDFEPASLRQLIARTAVTPFQYRLLVPTIVRSIHGPELETRLGLTPEDTTVVIDVVCVFASYLGLRALLRGQGWSDPRASSAALLIFYMLPFHYLLARHSPLRFVWDMPALMFFTLGLAALQRRSWSVYYPLFGIATFNKDTTIFLAFTQLVTDWGSVLRRRALAHFACQVAIWLAIRFALQRAFADNPGWGAMPNAISSNLRALLSPALLLVIASSFGFLWLPVVFLHQRIEGRFARRAVWVLVPFALGAMVVGSIYELRIWGELIPLIALAFLEIARGAPAANTAPAA